MKKQTENLKKEGSELYDNIVQLKMPALLPTTI
jgi:hypothetical protein